MSTIRYTLGGDYDSSNSHKLGTKTAGSPLSYFVPYYPYPGADAEQFRMGGPLGEVIVDKVNVKLDGVYADLSDSPDAYIVGGLKGDVLIGGDGDDQIYGSGGNDRITGGRGSDLLNGGYNDADTYVYLSAKDSTTHDPDRIFNFSGTPGDGDKIDVSAMGDFAFIRTDEFHGTGDAEIRISRLRLDWAVIGDVDGDGGSDFKIRIRVIGSHEPTVDEFVGAHVETPAHAFGGAHFTPHLTFAEPLHSLAHLALA